MNLTDTEYWSNHWKQGSLPKELNPKDRFHSYYCFHEFFIKYLPDDSKGKKIIEIGCGDSIVLPYFKKQYNLDIYGIDYSDIACKRSEQILLESGVTGRISMRDLFDPFEDLMNNFDYVYSNGVIEHFDDNTIALKYMMKFLNKDGQLITGIPNMTGLNFKLLKFLNRKVYDMHNVFSLEEFKDIHNKLGLKMIAVEVFPVSMYIPLDGLTGFRKMMVYLINKQLIVISKILNFFKFPPSAYLSCAFFIISKKQKEE
jgi:2-polyprenyl-3-methyl-5-hydroxy-6-metoxy-1,4-benzoquinol methylase